MQVKNNYQDCLTNVACSIRKYFNLAYHHDTNSFLDQLLEERKPSHVVMILFDGMGSRILERSLDKDSFFLKKKVKDITTVFPATTTAATTSVRTGLNPVEHGWLGWNTYIQPIDKTITLFLNSEKGKEELCEEFLTVKNSLVTKTIASEINEIGLYQACELFPFGENKYANLDEMLERIKKEVNSSSKKFIYAYDDEPDHSMHLLGPDSQEVRQLIKIRNDKIEELCKELTDTLVIVLADHGHIQVEPIYLSDYPEIVNMLERTPSIEQRAVSFKVKEGLQNKFREKFQELLGEYFSFYDKSDVINSQLFGDGKPNLLFNSAIGDFIAIAENSNKCLISEGDTVLFSHHAGYTEEEIFVPLIVIDCGKKE